MAQCKASIRNGERCQNDAERGYSFCEEHKTRPNAIKEREANQITTVIDATNTFPGTYQSENAESKAIAVRENQSVFEKASAALERAIDWEETTWSKVRALGDGWRYEDKNGMEQMRSEVGVHERAMDRVIRATTAMAKINVEAQGANVNKLLQETIKGVIMRVFKRMELSPTEIEQARIYLAEEFEKVNKQDEAS